MCGGDAAFLSNFFNHLLWPPCVADADIIFCSCGFYLSSSFFFFSSPNLSGRRLDVYYTSTRGAALVRFNFTLWTTPHFDCVLYFDSARLDLLPARWLGSLAVRALDLRLDAREFHYRLPWIRVTVFGRANHLSISTIATQVNSASYPQRDGK